MFFKKTGLKVINFLVVAVLLIAIFQVIIANKNKQETTSVCWNEIARDEGNLETDILLNIPSDAWSVVKKLDSVEAFSSSQQIMGPKYAGFRAIFPNRDAGYHAKDIFDICFALQEILKRKINAADIGSGGGYGSFRLGALKCVSKVYSVDNDKVMINYLVAWKKIIHAIKHDNRKEVKSLVSNLDDRKIIPVLCPNDNVGLKQDSVDISFLVDVYHCVFEQNSFSTWMKSLYQATTRHGWIVVVDSPSFGISQNRMLSDFKKHGFVAISRRLIQRPESDLWVITFAKK